MAALVLPVVLVGCASRPSASDAEQVAVDFYAAVGGSDGAAACALLTPAAAEQLAADEGSSCESAILTGEAAEDLLPRAGGVAAVDHHVAGRHAQVDLSTDVVFLTVSGDTWLITGAGCTPRADRPYHCALEGG